MLSRADEKIISATPLSLDRLMQAAGRAEPAEPVPIMTEQSPMGRLVRRWIPVPLLEGKMALRRRWMIFAVVLGVVAVVIVTFLLASTPEPEQPPTLPVAHEVVGEKGEPGNSLLRSADPGSPKRTDKPLVISVIGKVSQPGLVTVPAGSRVADALQAAGGVLANTDVTALNLARLLEDGEQLSVGLPVSPEMATGSSGSVGGTTKKIDLNTATIAQLDELPGVGSVTAQRIMEWRTRHGRFTKVEQLRDVDGIGESRFSKLREQVVVR